MLQTISQVPLRLFLDRSFEVLEGRLGLFPQRLSVESIFVRCVQVQITDTLDDFALVERCGPFLILDLPSLGYLVASGRELTWASRGRRLSGLRRLRGGRS